MSLELLMNIAKSLILKLREKKENNKHETEK